MADDAQTTFTEMPSGEELLDMIPRDEVESEPEAPEEAPEPDRADEGAEPETEAESQPRDEKGRFAEKSEDEGAPTEEAAPGAEEAETPATPEAPAPEAEAPEPEPERPEFQEYSYRAYGQDYSLPSSKHGSDGVFISNEGLPALQRMLGRAQGASRRETELRGELDQARAATAAQAAEAEKIVNEFGQLRELYRTQGPDAVLEWFSDLDRNWALIQAEAKAARLEQELESGKGRLSEIEQRESTDKLVPQIEARLQQAVDTLLQDERFKGLDGKRIYQRLAQTQLDRIFYEAQEDMPEINVSKGEVVFDPAPIMAEFNYALSWRPPVQTDKKAEKTKERNKAMTTEPKVPAVAPAGGGEAPSAEIEVPAFKSKEEAERWLESGDWQKAAS